MKRRNFFTAALAALTAPKLPAKPNGQSGIFKPDHARLSGKPVDPQKYLGQRVRLRFDTWASGWVRNGFEMEHYTRKDYQEILDYAREGVERGEWEEGWHGAELDVDAGTLGTVRPVLEKESRYHCYVVDWDDNADYKNRYTGFDDDEPGVFLEVLK